MPSCSTRQAEIRVYNPVCSESSGAGKFDSHSTGQGEQMKGWRHSSWTWRVTGLLGPGYPVGEPVPDSELSGITYFSLISAENLSLGDHPCAPEPCPVDKSRKSKQMLPWQQQALRQGDRGTGSATKTVPVMKLRLVTYPGATEPSNR